MARADVDRSGSMNTRTAGCAGAAGLLLALLIVTMAACSRSVNQPGKVADCLLEAMQEGSLEKMDTLMNWNEVAVNAYYFTEDFMKRQSKEQRQEAIKGFKQRLREEVLPLARQAKYELLDIYISRWKSDAVYRVTFPETVSNLNKPRREQQFTVIMNLDLGIKRWYITDLGDFISQNTLQGNYNPDTIYLSNPIRP